MDEGTGTIRVAPSVLTTIVTHSALSVPGVVGLDSQAGGGGRFRPGRGATGRGTRVDVQGDAVFIELYVIAEAGANLLDLGRQLQHEVARAVETMVGLPVFQVDVYIQDVR